MPNYIYKIPIREFVITQKGTKPLILKKKKFEGCIPYLDISVLENGIEKEYTFKELGNLATENDILVVWDGHRSGLVFRGKVGAIGSTLVGLTPVGLEQDYFYYFLKSQYDYIRGNTTGTGIPHVNPDVFFDIEIPYLPIKQQKETIKELKDKLNENAILLEKQKELIRETLSVTNIPIMEDEDMAKMIETFRQAVLQRAVSGELTEQWREDNIINIDYTKNNFPKNWNQQCIKEFIHVIDPNPSHRTPKEVKNGFPYIGIGNIDEKGQIDFEHSRKVGLDVLETQQKRFLIEKGDLMYGKIGTIGKPTKLPVEIKYTLSANTFLLKVIKDKIIPDYLYYLLLSEYSYKLITNEISNSSQPMLGIEKFRDISFFIPPLPEQHEIVRQVELLFAIADKAQKQYETAMEYFQKLEKSVLLQAFSGELVEAQAQTESLEVLLERIKVEREKLEKEKKVLRKEQAIFKQNIKNMEKKSIEEMLKEAPLSVEEIWQASVYFENKEVEKFYEELCKLSDDEKIDKYFLDDKKITTIVTLQEYAN